QASVTDLEFAHTVLVLGCEPIDESPILDLRIRKGVRRRGVALAIATARPSALDPNARAVLRYPPGGEAAFLAELEVALRGEQRGEEIDGLAALLRDGGDDVVILYGERVGADGGVALLAIAKHLGLSERAGAGLLEVPAGANSRGLREAGVMPDAGPGYSELAQSGRGAREIARAAADGAVSALYLFQTDPLREQPDRELWERALHSAALVDGHASVLTEGLREHASVIFPAESHAEKEGTVVPPDRRLQRLRIAIAHPGQVRAGWSVLAEIARRAGLDLGVQSSPMAFSQLVAAVPFYEGLTLEELGGQGVRWPEREQAAAVTAGHQVSVGMPQLPPPASDPHHTSRAAPSPQAENGSLRLGTYRPIWAGPEVEVSPALHYLIPTQQLELSPEDAARLGVVSGEAGDVAELDDAGAARSGEAGRRELDDSRAAGSSEAGRRAGGKREGKPAGTRL